MVQCVQYLTRFKDLSNRQIYLISAAAFSDILNFWRVYECSYLLTCKLHVKLSLH